MAAKFKIVHVVGARPQFMQAAPLRIAAFARGHNYVLVHTGQHYDDNMSKIFFEQLSLPEPDVNLEIGSGSHGIQTGAMLSHLDKFLLSNRPDVVVVDGDTNSTLAGALSAAKLRIPVVHVEAGLRSFDRDMPEELNRIVADHVASLLCAPTRTAMQNLKHEGLLSRSVQTGDLLYDCFLMFRDRAKKTILAQLGLQPGTYALATLHRAENTDSDERLLSIILALAELRMPVIFPVHPRTRARARQIANLPEKTSQLHMIEPVGYLDMLALEGHARCILTDSGGVQREAFFHAVPSVVLRETTEWLEQAQNNWSAIVGSDRKAIVTAVERFQVPPAHAPSIYGDGAAAKKVITQIELVFS